MSSNGRILKPADADIGWLDLKTSEGDWFVVKASDYDISEAHKKGQDSLLAWGPSFRVLSVDWVLGSEGSPSPDQQAESAITWYRLSKTPWWNALFSYELTIKSKDNYSYSFVDASGNSYKLSIYNTDGTHSLRYNSANPTIVAISGS